MLVVSAFLCLAVMAGPALGLGNALNLEVRLPVEEDGSSLPRALSLLSEASPLDPRQAPGTPVLQNTGTSLNLAPVQGATLTGGFYLSKRLGYLDASKDRFALADPYRLAMPFAPSGEGKERVLAQGRAVYQKLSYGSGRWSLTGLYQDVDPTFEAVAQLAAKDPLAKQLAGARGLKLTELGVKYDVRAGMGLAADYGTVTSTGAATTRASYQRLEGKLGRLSLAANLSQVDMGLAVTKEQMEGSARLKSLYALRGLEMSQYSLGYTPGRGMSLAAESAQVTSSHGGEQRASYQKVEGKLGRLSLSGSWLEVDARFQAAKDQIEGNPQLKSLVDSRGIESRQLALSYNAGRLGLATSYSRVSNEQSGHKDAGTTRTETRQEIKAQLGSATLLGITHSTLQLAQNATGQVGTDTATSTLSLAHTFTRGLSASFTKELVSGTSNGGQAGSDLSALHVEYKPRPGLSLAMDTRDRSFESGAKEALRLITFDTAMGQGWGKLALKGELKQAQSGLGGAQRERGNRLSLTAGQPRLALALDWQTLQQQGPSATRDYQKLVGKLTSQVNPYTKLTASLHDESDLDQRLRAERSYRLEMTPARFSLTVGRDELATKDRAPTTATYASLQWKAGAPLAPWAKELGSGSQFADPGRYGFARMPGWAKIPETGLQYGLISRQVQGGSGQDTQSLGYQRMIGRLAYLRLAMQENPLDDKGNPVAVRRSCYELGARLGRGSLVVRSLSEQNTQNGQGAQTLSLLTQQAVGGRLALTGGYQATAATNGTETRMHYAGITWKFGRPLAPWAAEASEAGVVALFPDALTYGYRKLPAWKLLPDQGLYYQLTARGNEQGEGHNTSLLGYQTMLGRRSYLKLSLQEHPLDEKNNLTLAHRKLVELGRRLGGKLTLLGRLTSEGAAPGTGLDSRMVALFGQLSAKERVSTVLIFDSAHYPGVSYHATTLGVEYSRELAEDHYLCVKATSTQSGKPSVTGPEAGSYRVDLAYRKDI